MIGRRAAFAAGWVAVASAFALLGPSEVSTARTVTPAAGTVDRSGIMEAIRQGTGTDGPFLIEHLRVADAPGIKIAYAQVRPVIAANRRGFTGWAVLTAKKTAWEVMWAVRRDGNMQTCSEVRGAYNYARRVAALADADRTFFSPSFDQSAEEVAAGSPDDLCNGAIIVDDQGGE